MERAVYFGSLPCSPDKKRACLIKDADRKVFIFSPEVPEESNLVEVAVSTDQIHCGFMEMAPGSTWHFVDEHLGDETYYIISGNLTEQECVSGECVEAHAGDTLYIPMGCKHKGYNFSEEKQRIFWVIAPTMWPEETDTSFPHKAIRTYKNGKDEFDTGAGNESACSLRKEYKLHLSNVGQLGTFPVPGEDARRKPIYYYVMNERNCLTTVFGLKYPMRMRFFVSNDFLHVGEFYLPAGGVGSRVSEVDEHIGDTVIYGVKGPTTVFLPDTTETFQVQDGAVLYLPPRVRHQFINYNRWPIIGYFAVAREL